MWPMAREPFRMGQLIGGVKKAEVHPSVLLRSPGEDALEALCRDFFDISVHLTGDRDLDRLTIGSHRNRPVAIGSKDPASGVELSLQTLLVGKTSRAMLSHAEDSKGGSYRFDERAAA